MDSQQLYKKLKERVATLSTETLKRYYNMLKQNVIPPTLSEFSELDIKVLIMAVEDELSLRGELQKIKRVYIQ